jgi:hypothetical protein
MLVSVCARERAGRGVFYRVGTSAGRRDNRDATRQRVGDQLRQRMDLAAACDAASEGVVVNELGPRPRRPARSADHSFRDPHRAGNRPARSGKCSREGCQRMGHAHLSGRCFEPGGVNRFSAATSAVTAGSRRGLAREIPGNEYVAFQRAYGAAIGARFARTFEILLRDDERAFRAATVYLQRLLLLETDALRGDLARAVEILTKPQPPLAT